jgi:hypothetical protein
MLTSDGQVNSMPPGAEDAPPRSLADISHLPWLPISWLADLNCYTNRLAIGSDSFEEERFCIRKNLLECGRASPLVTSHQR